MDKYTRETLQWLDYRYGIGAKEGRYRAHEPVFGVGCEYAEPDRAVRLARAYSLFRRLSTLDFGSLLDVGGSEGFHASLVQKLFSVPTLATDLSVEAGRRAWELFRLPTVASDAHWLPFAEASFDVVMCCEVLEHVLDPVAVMCEVLRVARRYAVFSTEQLLRGPRVREIMLLLCARPDEAHGELHWFVAEDFRRVWGPRQTQERQCLITPRLQELAATGQEATAEEVRALVWEATRLGPPDEMDRGIIVVAAKDGAPLPNLEVPGDEALLDALLGHTVSPEVTTTAPPPTEMPAFVQEALACPRDLTPLVPAAGAFHCPTCGQDYPVEHGIPTLYPEGEQPHDPGRRWPWLTSEGAAARDLFTRPRPTENRLLDYLLTVELGLLGACGSLPAPPLDYGRAEAVRQALVSPDLEPETDPGEERWWEQRPASEAELAAMRALGENVVKLKTYLVALSQAYEDSTRQAAALTTSLADQTQQVQELSARLDRFTSFPPIRLLRGLKRLLRKPAAP